MLNEALQDPAEVSFHLTFFLWVSHTYASVKTPGFTYGWKTKRKSLLRDEHGLLDISVYEIYVYVLGTVA